MARTNTTDPIVSKDSLTTKNDPSATREQTNIEKAKLFRSDPNQAVFNPQAKEILTTWHSSARTIFALNTYPNGITMSVHPNSIVPQEDEATKQHHADGSDQSGEPKYLTSQFHLRFKDTKDYQLPAGKYFLYKENYAETLEHQLATLHKQGTLGSSVFYLGTTADPFYNFQKRFDTTITCLELLEQYRPGLVVVQTRSPMVIAALPLLKMLGDRVVVGMPIESRLESSILRYTPGQPRIAERLMAVDGLRRQGIAVNLIVSPLLPYGDFYRDAWDFADMLDKHADHISFGCLASGSPSEEHQLKMLPVAQRLVADKQFRLLRPYSYRYVYYAVSQIAPEKLLLPVKVQATNPSQLSLFAAA